MEQVSEGVRCRPDVEHERRAQSNGHHAEENCAARTADDWRSNSDAGRKSRKKDPQHLTKDDNPDDDSARTSEQPECGKPVGEPWQIGKDEQREREERQERIRCRFPERLTAPK